MAYANIEDRRAYHRAYYQLRKADPAWRERANTRFSEALATRPELRKRRSEAAKRWRDANPEKCKEMEQNRRLKGRECPKAWAKLWVKNARKRARKDGTQFELTWQQVFELLPADMLCPVTRKPLTLGGGDGQYTTAASVDRIRPEKGYVFGNVRILSFKANTMRQDCLDPEIFRRLAALAEADLARRS